MMDPRRMLRMSIVSTYLTQAMSVLFVAFLFWLYAMLIYSTTDVTVIGTGLMMLQSAITSKMTVDGYRMFDNAAKHRENFRKMLHDWEQHR